MALAVWLQAQKLKSVDLCQPSLWLARFRRVVRCLSRTAKTETAAGCVVPSADDLATPTEPQPSGLTEMAADDVLIARTRRELDDAIQQHMRAMYGSLVTIDWVLVAENVNDEDNHLLHPAISENMSGWKLRGMSWEAFKFMQAITQ